jgi:hypothetical protein
MRRGGGGMTPGVEAKSWPPAHLSRPAFLSAMMAVLFTAVVACGVTQDLDTEQEFATGDLKALLTAVTDSLGALVLDTTGVSGAGPDPFFEVLYSVADSLGIFSPGAMEEARLCAATFGMNVPPEDPLPAPEEVARVCAQAPDGVFRISSPRPLSGGSCLGRAICWEANVDALILRTKTGLGDGSLVEMRAKVTRFGPYAVPLVELELLGWIIT